MLVTLFQMPLRILKIMSIIPLNNGLTKLIKTALILYFNIRHPTNKLYCLIVNFYFTP